MFNDVQFQFLGASATPSCQQSCGLVLTWAGRAGPARGGHGRQESNTHVARPSWTSPMLRVCLPPTAAQPHKEGELSFARGLVRGTSAWRGSGSSLSGTTECEHRPTCPHSRRSASEVVEQQGGALVDLSGRDARCLRPRLASTHLKRCAEVVAFLACPFTPVKQGPRQVWVVDVAKSKESLVDRLWGLWAKNSRERGFLRLAMLETLKHVALERKGAFEAGRNRSNQGFCPFVAQSCSVQDGAPDDPERRCIF